jgi:Tfp pilus assembly protein PilV
MVALVIFAVSMLALLTVMGSIMSYNLQNEVRNEALKVLESSITQLKNNQVPASPAIRTVRGVSIPYTVNSQVNTIGELRQITATVTWQFKGNNYSHSIITLVD